MNQSDCLGSTFSTKMHTPQTPPSLAPVYTESALFYLSFNLSIYLSTCSFHWSSFEKHPLLVFVGVNVCNSQIWPKYATRRALWTHQRIPWWSHCQRTLLSTHPNANVPLILLTHSHCVEKQERVGESPGRVRHCTPSTQLRSNWRNKRSVQSGAPRLAVTLIHD